MILKIYFNFFKNSDFNMINFLSPSNFDKALNSGKIFITSDSLTLLDNKMCFGQIPKNRLTKFLTETWKTKKMYFSSNEVGDIYEK